MAADVGLCGSREGEQQRVCLESPGRVCNVGAGSHDMNAVDVEATLRRVIIEERDRVEIRVRILQQCVADLLPGLAGSEDQRAVLTGVARPAGDLDDEAGEVANTEGAEELVGPGSEDGAERNEVRCSGEQHDSEGGERREQSGEARRGELPRMMRAPGGPGTGR